MVNMHRHNHHDNDTVSKENSCEAAHLSGSVTPFKPGTAAADL